MRADLVPLGYPQPWRPLPGLLPTGSTAADQGQALAQMALERLAEESRSPVEADLPLLLEEAFGVDVAVIEHNERFDGLASPTAEAKVIVLSKSTAPTRQRYTLVHELGHLLADDGDHEVHLDEDIYDRDRGKDLNEVRANSFAAAFLMPEQALRRAVDTVGLTERTFAALACDLMVAPSALATRLGQLSLIDAGSCNQFKRLNGPTAASIANRNDEFARSIAKATTLRAPGLLVRDSYAAYEAGVTTLRPLANLLGTDVNQLRSAISRLPGDG